MKNEVRPIDANAAIEALAANFRQASVDGCDNSFYQIAEDTIAEMPTLRSVPTGEALTEEQLKTKIGNPVFIKSERRAEWMILWGYHPPEVYGRAFVFTRRTAQKELFPFSGLGVTWNAYAYPPTHIDREAWEPCEYCGGAKYVYGHASAVVPNGDKGQIETEVEGDFDYCPECGRPLTPEAWAMLEKRLMG